MKRSKSIISIALASALIITTPVLGLADTNVDNVQEPVKQEKVKKVKEEKEKKNNKENQGKGQDKSWKETKDLLEAEKDVLEVEKDKLEAEKDQIEKELEAAEISENKELVEQLKTKISEIETQRLEVKSEMKNTINLMKETVKNRYSIEELEELRKIGEELAEQDGDVTIIPIENINAKNKDIKFDTPPVIKEGRTLIPVRALTQGFGATVDWNAEDKKVTITKGDVEIVLHLDSKIAIVNGEEIELEVPSTSYSNRTYVPLRFIVENLGLKIEYDEDTGLIEVDDEENQDEEDAEEVENDEDDVDDEDDEDDDEDLTQE